MSAFGILSRLRILFGCILILLLAGCGPSTIGKHIAQQIDDTKRQIKPADIQAALAPFFSTKLDSNGFGREITTPLPERIRTLPIFADSPDGIMFFLDSSNMLSLMIGSGFGHWGMVIIRPGSHETYDGNNETASIPWADGVYFFSQYR